MSYHIQCDSCNTVTENNRHVRDWVIVDARSSEITAPKISVSFNLCPECWTSLQGRIIGNQLK